MSNIINVKEERNVLSFVGEVFNIVANSSNFYLKFELDSEWDLNRVVTAIFNFDGRYVYVELDENRMCQIPPTNSSRIWFCITTEPDEVSKLSSTILSLDVEASGETDLGHIEEYQSVHSNVMGIVHNLLSGNNIKAKNADFAEVAGVSQTQVSLTGDEDVAGEKNFTGTIKHKSKIVPNCSQISNQNLLFNGDFKINQRGKSTYTRAGEDIYTFDRWGLFVGNGTIKSTLGKILLTGADESQPTVLCQWIEDSNYLIFGETITVSATINDIRYSKTITLPDAFEEDYIDNIYESEGVVFRIYVNKKQSVVGVQFLVENGVGIYIEKVKLEVSDFETKYYERSEAEDLALCQRYFQKLLVYSVAYGTSTEKIAFFAPTPVTMRGVSKVTSTSTPSLMIDGTKIKLTAENIKLNSSAQNGVAFSFTTTDVVKDKVYYVMTGTIMVEGEYYL